MAIDLEQCDKIGLFKKFIVTNVLSKGAQTYEIFLG